MLISVISVLFAVMLVACLMNYSFNAQLYSELCHETELICSGLENGGADYMKGIELHGMRVTWISADKHILYDSDEDYSDDNPLILSDEVLDARVNGRGTSKGKLKTISSKSMNNAIRLGDGSVVRTEDVHPSFAARLADIVQPLLIYLAAAAAAAVLISVMISKRILRPINDIDPDQPDPKKAYPEVAPLLKKLHDQKGRISKQLDELRHSREQFSLITESMSEGLVITDPKLTILACNSAAPKLLDSDSTGEGQSIYTLNNSPEFRRCIQNAAGGRNSGCIIKTDNGDREVIASPANSLEAVNGIVVFIMDVTEKEKLETMRREFTSNVSHELKTPLTTIYGISDMLANGIVKQEDVPGFGENIRSEADRLISLINDIVSLSKLDEGVVPDEDEEVDLCELTKEIFSRLELKAAEKDVELNLKGENVKYFGCRTILDEVIFNLCDNAVKYNREGGAVEVKVSHAPQNIFITVSDTGIGIPKKDISRIFERFYRVDKSRSRKIKGTGLGLSIVKHGIMYHNGTIKAESAEGRGTVFTISLPVIKKNA